MKISIHPTDIVAFLYISSLYLLYGSFRPVIELSSALILLLPIIMKRRIIKDEFLTSKMFFLIFSLLSIGWSEYITDSLYGTRGIIECVICGAALIAYGRNSENRIKNIVNYIVLSSVLMILRVLVTVPLSEIINRNYSGVFNANQIGIRCAFCAVLEYWLLKQNKSKKGVSLLIFIIMCFCSVVSGSKKALVLLALSIIIIEISISKHVISTIKKYIGAVLFLAFLYYISTKNQYIYSLIGVRFEGLIKAIVYGQEKGDASTRERFLLIQLGIQYWKAKPIFGYGINTFSPVVKYMGYADKYIYSHNNYIELMVGVGVVGLLVYYYYFVIMAIKIIKNKKRSNVGLYITLLFSIIFLDIGMVSYGDEFVQFLLTVLNILLEFNNDKSSFSSN